MTSRGRVNKLLSLCNLKTSIEIPINQANIEENKGDTFNCFDYDIKFELNSIFETVKNIVTQPSQIESDTLVENFVMEQTDQAQYEYIEIGSINPNQCFKYDNIEQENQIQNDNVVEAEIESEDPNILLPKRKRLKNSEKWKRNIKKPCKVLGNGRQSKTTRVYCKTCSSSLKYKMKTPNSNRKLSNMAYFLEEEEVGKIRVCKKMFESTLVISDKVIRNCFNKLNTAEILEPLNRGKHDNHKQISEEIKKGVLDHIDSFPRISSHYLRAQTSREYIDSSLTIAEINIGFFQPKKDQCSICEAWKNFSDIEKEINQTNYDAHMEAKIKCREEKEKDVAKAREGMVQVCCYDLQAVLQTPCGEVNMFYYKRKLGVYNFTVYETSSRNGYCYVWSEDKAKRGTNEIASCL
ncbi:hypothetical protein QTP88_016832 [Uroleucon formosanum]